MSVKRRGIEDKDAKQQMQGHSTVGSLGLYLLGFLWWSKEGTFTHKK